QAAGGIRDSSVTGVQTCALPIYPLFVTHSVADILRARMLAIACGYEDADDLDHLRSDPGFKLACGRLPDSGRDLCSQPTVSRWRSEERRVGEEGTAGWRTAQYRK